MLRRSGFTSSQLRTSVLVQATTLIGLVLVVAVPAGIVGGRALWSLTSTWLGIPIHQVVPVAAIALVAVGALLVGNIAALVPAISAGRIDAGQILRSE